MEGRPVPLVLDHCLYCNNYILSQNFEAHVQQEIYFLQKKKKKKRPVQDAIQLPDSTTGDSIES